MNSFLVPASSLSRRAIASGFLHSRMSCQTIKHNNILCTLPILHRKYINGIPRGSNKMEDDVGLKFRMKQVAESFNSETVTKDTSLKSKAKQLWNDYGYIAIGTHFSVWVVTLTSVFLSLDFDIFNAASFGLDPAGVVLKACHLLEYWTGDKNLPDYIRENPRVGSFAIAFIMTKLTEPPRILITLTAVPVLSRWFRKSPVKVGQK